MGIRMLYLSGLTTGWLTDSVGGCIQTAVNFNKTAMLDFAEMYHNQALRIHDVIKSVCVHPYEKVYQSETECYCEICGHDFTEQTVL